MYRDFANLYDNIVTLSKGKEIVYLRNPGNWGDGLIRAGFEAFAERFSLNYVEADPECLVEPSRKFAKLLYRYSVEKKKDQVLLYGGGGGWCKNYDSVRRLVDNASKRYEHVIVLPSTYELPPFKRYKNVTFFRRDNNESASVLPESRFCHDLAFFLTEQNFEFEIGSGGGVGWFLREDHESSRLLSRPFYNRDISREGTADSDVTDFLRVISSYDEVVTDRLHVAIGCCVMGVKVKFYPGNYFKNKSVYESSMIPYFNEIAHFCE